jgi:hypothetical protein
MKSTFLRTFLLFVLPCLMFVSSAHAQIQDMTTYMPADNEDYRGYVITHFNFQDIGQGYLAAGNRTAGGTNHSTIHLLRIPLNSSATTALGTNIQYNEDDVRVVAITQISTDTIALTIQARTSGLSDRILVTLIDCSTFSATPTIANTLSVENPEGSLYPMAAALGGHHDLYVSGFRAYSTAYPTEPRFTTDKEAFVADVDLNGVNATNVRMYNTTQNLTTPPPGTTTWNGLYTDYDVAMRLRYDQSSGRLFTAGAGNGTAQTAWIGYGMYNVNASKAWVAELNPSTLAVINQDYFGNNYGSLDLPPSIQVGYSALDLLDDPNNSGEFQLLGNDMEWHCWYMTHIDASMNVSVPSGGNNTIFFNAHSTGTKAFGAYPQTSGAARVSVFGSTTSSGPFGLIPFTMGMDIGYSSATGSSVTNVAWYLQYNSAPSNSPFTTGAWVHPFWINTDLAQWSMPIWSAQADPTNGVFDLATMGHFLQSPNVVPRFIQGDADGYVSTCAGSSASTMARDMTTLNLMSMAVSSSNHQWQPSANIVTSPGISDINHTTFQCTASQPYKPLSALSLQAAKSTMKVFPNPASEYVEVGFAQSLKKGDVVTMSILDMTGRLVYSGTATTFRNGNAHFNLPILTPGLYTCFPGLNAQEMPGTKLSIR